MKKTAWIWSAMLATLFAFVGAAGAQDSQRGALVRKSPQGVEQRRGASLAQRKAPVVKTRRAPTTTREKARTLSAQRANSPAPRRR